MTEVTRLQIDRLGAQGDGVAEDSSAGRVFVPFALAGETIDACIEGERARIETIVRAADQRVEPVCGHFGRCGGCALQHFEAEGYRSWKAELVSQALASRGIAAELERIISVGHGARRRATLTAKRAGRDVLIGFHEAGSNELVDIVECPVLAPQIVSVLAGVRDLIGPLINDRSEARVYILKADNGLDVDISTTGAGLSGKLSAKGRAVMAGKAKDLGLVRLSLDGDPLYQSGAPEIRCGRASIVPPPGIFLQASGEAERAMAGLVAGAFGKRARMAADLFCGVGAFSFALAERAKVLAIDSDTAAIAALEDGRRRTQGLRGIETRVRDLFHEPLSRKELEPFDLVVFDPPRAGAKAQAEMLAKSKVQVVAAVSCSPATLARDLRILIDGGYRLESVTPIDQFLYSPHVETVAVLRR
ncbi:MAG: methyltransferase domain-containing protein [Alphaproteobacteria bacterium]|nr:methyltransferase domain-containing protein [Alphaproteobacteria bacterium]